MSKKATRKPKEAYTVTTHNGWITGIGRGGKTITAADVAARLNESLVVIGGQLNATAAAIKASEARSHAMLGELARRTDCKFECERMERNVAIACEIPDSFVRVDKLALRVEALEKAPPLDVAGVVGRSMSMFEYRLDRLEHPPKSQPMPASLEALEKLVATRLGTQNEMIERVKKLENAPPTFTAPTMLLEKKPTACCCGDTPPTFAISFDDCPAPKPTLWQRLRAWFRTVADPDTYNAEHPMGKGDAAGDPFCVRAGCLKNLAMGSIFCVDHQQEQSRPVWETGNTYTGVKRDGDSTGPIAPNPYHEANAGYTAPKNNDPSPSNMVITDKKTTTSPGSTTVVYTFGPKTADQLSREIADNEVAWADAVERKNPYHGNYTEKCSSLIEAYRAAVTREGGKHV